MIIKIPKFRKNSIAQDAVNCWLRYALSQPVDLDLRLVFILLLRFFGLPGWQETAQRVFHLTAFYRLALSTLTRSDALGKIDLPEFTLAESHYPYPSAN